MSTKELYNLYDSCQAISKDMGFFNLTTSTVMNSVSSRPFTFVEESADNDEDAVAALPYVLPHF